MTSQIPKNLNTKVAVTSQPDLEKLQMIHRFKACSTWNPAVYCNFCKCFWLLRKCYFSVKVGDVGPSFTLNGKVAEKSRPSKLNTHIIYGFKARIL